MADYIGLYGYGQLHQHLGRFLVDVASPSNPQPNAISRIYFVSFVYNFVFFIFIFYWYTYVELVLLGALIFSVCAYTYILCNHIFYFAFSLLPLLLIRYILISSRLYFIFSSSRFVFMCEWIGLVWFGRVRSIIWKNVHAQSTTNMNGGNAMWVGACDHNALAFIPICLVVSHKTYNSHRFLCFKYFDLTSIRHLKISKACTMIICNKQNSYDLKKINNNKKNSQK